MPNTIGEPSNDLTNLVQLAQRPLTFMKPILHDWIVSLIDEQLQTRYRKLDMANPCCTVSEFAAFVRVHPETVRSWIKLPDDDPRHLAAIHTGNAYIIDPPTVTAWIARNRASQLAEVDQFLDGLAA